MAKIIGQTFRDSTLLIGLIFDTIQSRCLRVGSSPRRDVAVDATWSLVAFHAGREALRCDRDMYDRDGTTRQSARARQCGNQPVRQAGLEVLFTILAASTQRESAWRPRTRHLRLIHPNV